MEILPKRPSVVTRLAFSLACLSVAAAGCVLYARLHAPTETKPVTITENTLAGRRVRFVSPDEGKPAEHSVPTDAGRGYPRRTRS